MLLKRSVALLVSIVFVFSLVLNIFPQQARAQDTIKIVGSWQDAGNWNFESSNIVLSETSTPGLYYGEYTFQNAGEYKFKVVENGTWHTTVTTLGYDSDKNIIYTAQGNDTLKFWYFKNSHLLLLSYDFPNGPEELVGQKSFKFVGLNDEWNPNDGKYQFVKVPDATYTYVYDNTFNDFSIPWGFKIIIGGFDSNSWVWNVTQEGSVVKFKEGVMDNINLPQLKESNGNLLKTKFYLDILNGWLFTEKDLTNIQPADFANNSSVIGGSSVHLAWAPYTPNANPLSAKLYYKIIDVSNNSELVSLSDYSTSNKIDIPRDWIGKTIKIVANARIGEITGPDVEFTLNVVDLPQNLIVEAANYITYNSIDETFLNLAQGDTIQSITSNFSVVTSYVYSVVYEGNNYPLTFTIDWESSNSSVLAINGGTITVTRPTQGDLQVDLKARARFGSVEAEGQKTFTLTVKKFLLGVDGGVPVTFNVTVPDYTPANDNIYIAGDFKTDKLPKWDPSGIKLTKVGEKKYSVTMYLPPNVTIEYKYTRGNWSKVEKDAFGNEIPNRVLQINNQPVTKEDMIEAFADLGPVKQGLPSVSLVINVPQQTVFDTGDGGKVIKAEGGAISVPNAKNTVLIDSRSALNAIIKGENYTVVVKSSQQTYPVVSIEKQAVESLKQKGAKNIEVKYSDTSVFVDIYNSAPSDIQVQTFQVPKEKIKIEESKLLTAVDDYTNIKILSMRNFKIVRGEEVDKSSNAIYVFKLSSPIDDGVVPVAINDNGITPIKDFYIEGEYVIVKGKGSQTIGFAKVEKKFSDVDSIENSVATLVSLGIIQGDNENCLNLDKFVSRAELAALFGRTFDLSQKYYRGYFADISKYNWYAPYVEALKENGILDGYNNKFNPNGFVTREQLSKIAVNIAEKYVSETLQKKDIADLEKASGWAKEYIQKALAYKVMDVDEQGNFRPQDYATRNEVFTTLYNLIMLKNKDLKNYITSDLKPLGVEVTFKVKVPQNTPDDNIHIAGTFSSIGYSDWNPSDNNLKLSKNSDGTYSITMYIPEGTTIEYKYVRGEWSKVEKGPNGEELSNRSVTIKKGTDNKMLIEDTVSKWADK